METHSEPSIVNGLMRAFEAGERIVLNRIDLAKLDILNAVSEVARSSALLACAGALMAIGWASVSVAGIMLLERWTASWPASAALIGGLNIAGGLIAVSAALRSPQREAVVEGERS